MKRFPDWYYSRTDLYRLRVIALFTLVLLAVVPSIIALLGDESFYGLLLNFGTEMASALVTFLVFDRLIGRYEKRERGRPGARLDGASPRPYGKTHSCAGTRCGVIRGSETRIACISAPVYFAHQGWVHYTLRGSAGAGN